MHQNEPSKTVLRRIRPRWFTSVMGTGIVANAAAGLPGVGSDLRGFALVVWLISALWLATLVVAWVTHAVRYRDSARGHADDAAEAPMYGAVPMALMTVGAGALTVGHYLIGTRAALAVDWTLWSLGTVGGLMTIVAVPYLMFTRYRLRPEDASGAWLMPVVPPMVSAANGVLLIPHLPAGQARETLLIACLALFGMAAVATALIVPMIWTRLTHFSLPSAALQPALWIVIGPFGTSVTAATTLSKVAPTTLNGPDASAMHAFALLYGAPAWGFALMWLGLVGAITVRALREGLPFNLSWWSFVFPLGTLVTATNGLAVRTGSTVLEVIAAILLVALVGAWLTVAAATVQAHGKGVARWPRPSSPRREGRIVPQEGSVRL
jgi:C4-dicarboxylate transporter/malic acid transport protein